VRGGLMGVKNDKAEATDRLASALRAFSVGFEALSIAMREMAEQVELLGPGLGNEVFSPETFCPVCGIEDPDLNVDYEAGKVTGCSACEAGPDISPGGMNELAYVCTDCGAMWTGSIKCPNGCEDEGET